MIISYDGNDFHLISGTGTASNDIAVGVGSVAFPFTATITDSSDNVLCKYTVSQSEVDSSNLLTFGAIDESFARKTEIESLQSTIEELIFLFTK